ncbi:helix-turn-helix transcriptional regulator [Bdellovibrio sp. SKB1291214]|uniref:winged helix-turn-helix transcriptional regulator n=1 Tax=Bdellovibrio sp. SKB1291214 TaxID=1732569 RepID=UPI000B51DD2A|nr:helix-turn-helix domain-containing protein [Bdellovibrio sp. SKB1291214]UYL08849.1 helix-turn-helix transcriptional regulator [Bdellovibrio sp. SKB1291214]
MSKVDDFFEERIEGMISKIRRKPLFDETCIFSLGARLLGDKWTIIILVILMEGKKRYSELQRQIPTISPKMLAQTLKKLEQLDLVKRQVYPEVPPRVEYELTSFGKSVRPAITILCEWSVEHDSKIRRVAKNVE